MANFAAITLGTGETARTYSPAGHKAGAAVYENRKSGVPVGYGRLSVRKTANANVRRDRFVLELPKLQTSTSAASDGFVPQPRVQHVDRVTVEFVSSNLSGTVDRKGALDDIIAILQNSLTTDIVVNQEEV